MRSCAHRCRGLSASRVWVTPSAVFIPFTRMPSHTLRRVNLQPEGTKQRNFSCSYIHVVNIHSANIPVDFWGTVVQLGLLLGIIFPASFSLSFLVWKISYHLCTYDQLPAFCLCFIFSCLWPCEFWLLTLPPDFHILSLTFFPFWEAEAKTYILISYVLPTVCITYNQETTFFPHTQKKTVVMQKKVKVVDSYISESEFK